MERGWRKLVDERLRVGEGLRERVTVEGEVPLEVCCRKLEWRVLCEKKLLEGVKSVIEDG